MGTGNLPGVETSSAPVHLFVYGTLRRAAAHPMHSLLFPADRVGTGCVRGWLYDLGAYPGAIFSDEASSAVHGEVYRLHDPPAILARLDAYEACTDADPAPHEYRRVQLGVCLEAGESLTVWAYAYQRAVAGLTPVPSGDWLLGRNSPPDPSSTGA